MGIFDFDSPLIQSLSKMADLMWLNILTVICCIPVFTAGAALTALHYMVLKIERGEEGYITKGYFKSFKENFKQSTLIWLIFLVVFCVLAVDFRIITTSDMEINSVIRVLLLVFGVIALSTFMFVFPVQAKFANPVKATIWNSFLFSLARFPKTVLMVILYIIPYVVAYYYPAIIPVVLVFCLSLPAYLSAKLYNKFFLQMEEQILARVAAEKNENSDETESEEEDEAIFSDKPMFPEESEE